MLQDTGIEEKLVLDVLKWAVYDREILNAEDLITRKDINWGKVEGFLRYHELLPFANVSLEKYSCLLPKDIFTASKKDSYFFQVYLHHLYQEFIRLASAFNGEKLRFVPLKGAAFLVDNLYGDKNYFRPMSDIDLFVKDEDLPLTEKILARLGYGKELAGKREEYWRKKNYHLGFIRRNKNGFPCYAEIHWALDYRRDKPILPYLWARIRREQIGEVGVYLLSPEDTLFSLALHQRRYGRMLCLKNVCDTALLLNRYNTGLDWDYILKEARNGGISTSMYFIFAQADILLDVKIPSFVLSGLGVPTYKKQLIERFIIQGTFAPALALPSPDDVVNTLYLKSHFLLFDNFLEPIRYALNLPQEQFAKFYRLPPYALKTNLLYGIRWFYFINSLFRIILKTAKGRLTKYLGIVFNPGAATSAGAQSDYR